MGYITEFGGEILIDPPLSIEEINYIEKFNLTHRCHRKSGPYYIDGCLLFDRKYDSDVIDANQPAEGQPDNWCNLTVSRDGKSVISDGGLGGNYHTLEWMKYFIDHFLGANPKAKDALPFITGHILNGELKAQGENPEDIWTLVVNNNHAYRLERKLCQKEAQKILEMEIEQQEYDNLHHAYINGIVSSDSFDNTFLDRIVSQFNNLNLKLDFVVVNDNHAYCYPNGNREVALRTEVRLREPGVSYHPNISTGSKSYDSKYLTKKNSPVFTIESEVCYHPICSAIQWAVSYILMNNIGGMLISESKNSMFSKDDVLRLFDSSKNFLDSNLFSSRSRKAINKDFPEFVK